MTTEDATVRVKMHVGDGTHGALGVTYIVYEDTDVTNDEDLHDPEREVAVCYARDAGKARAARIVTSWNNYDTLRDHAEAMASAIQALDTPGLHEWRKLQADLRLSAAAFLKDFPKGDGQ